jgi:hypothetical protein
VRDRLSPRSSSFVVTTQAGRSARRGERPKGGPDGASEAPVFGRCVPARLPLTQRAFRRPAGRRVTFLLLAHARAFCVRTAKPARTRGGAMDGAGFEERGRAEGASPESKSHGISFASKVTQRKRPLEPGLVAI